MRSAQKRVLYKHSLAPLLTGVFVVFAVVFGSLIRTPVSTLAATNGTLNFQARLESSTGAIVPDGSYNIEFKLYNVSSAGSALWTEDYYDSNGATAGNDNRVTVRNGYVTVNLGSITSFPTNINWDQDLWLTLNVGGTTQTATPTYDGEMNPRLKLTGVPYAFKAGQLAKLTGGNTSTLDWASQTGARSILLPDESGTICIQNSANCGFLTSTAANGAYVQLQGTTPGSAQTGNFNISGKGIADVLQATTNVLTPLLDSITASQLGIGTGTASSVSISKSGATTTVNGALTVTQATNLSSSLTVTGPVAFKKATDYSTTGSANDVAISTTSLVRLTGASAQTITGIVAGSDGQILTIINAAGQAATITNNDAASSAANRIITGTGSSLTLAAGSSITLVYDTGASLWRVVGDVAGAGGGGSGVTTVGAFSASSQANGATISGSTITFGPADGTNPGMVSTGTQTFAGAKTFSSLLTGSAGASINGGAITLQGNTASSFTTTSGALTVTSAAAATWSTSAGALTVQGYAGLNLDTGSAAAINIGSTNANAVNIGQNTTIASGKTFDVLGAATFRNASNSTGAFRVQNAAGTDVLNVDTSYGRVDLGTNTISAGYRQVGTNVTNSAGNSIMATKITPSVNGTLKSISYFFGDSDSAPNNKFQVAIYADGSSCGALSSCPGTLIANSGDNTIVTGKWLDIPISASLTGSTSYWLAVTTNATGVNSNGFYDSASGDFIYQTSGTYGSWASTFVTAGAATSATVALSLYANIQTSSTGYALSTNLNGVTTASNDLNVMSSSTSALVVGTTVTDPVLTVDTLNRSVGINTVRPTTAALEVSGLSYRPGIYIRGAASQTADLLQLGYDFTFGGGSGYGTTAAFNNTGAQLTLGHIGASNALQGKLILSDGTTDNFGITLQSSTLTANRTITLPNEAGTICIQNSSNCGFLTSTTANSLYIQLQGTTPGSAQTGNFNITGTGIAGTALQAPTIQGGSSQQFTINTSGNAAFTADANHTISVATIGSTGDGKNLTISAGGATSTGSTPTIVGNSMSFVNNTNTVTVNYPSGIQAGDMLVLFAGHGYSVNAPSGWTAQDNSTGSNANGAVYTKVVAQSDIGGYQTVTFGGSYYGEVAIVAARNVTGVRNAVYSRSSTGTNADTISGLSANAGDLIFYGGFARLTNAAFTLTRGSTLDSRSTDSNAGGITAYEIAPSTTSYSETYNLSGTPGGRYYAMMSFIPGTTQNGGNLILSGGASTGYGQSGVRVATSTNSPIAFQVQNASGSSLLNVDTTNTKVSVGVAGGAVLANSNVVTDSMTSTPSGSLIGVATYVAGSYVELTHNVGGTYGAIEYTPAMSSNFEANYQMYTSGTADAQYFYAFATSTPTNEGSADGGYKVYFSEWSNTVGLEYNGSTLTSVAKSSMNDAAWHSIQIRKSGLVITVSYDGTQLISYTDTARTLNGTLFGLGARSGGSTAYHRVKSLTLDSIIGTGAKDVSTVLNGTLKVQTGTANSSTALQVMDVSGTNIFGVDTASGYLTTSRTDGSGFLFNTPTMSSGNMFRLLNNGTAKFNVDYTGAIQGASLDTLTAGGTLTLGGTNATGGISLAQNTTVASGKTLTVTSGLTNLKGNTTGDALNVSNNTSTGNIALFKDNNTTVATIADGGAVTLQNSVNSTSAFNINNATGSSVVKVDTTNTRVGINNSSPAAALDVVGAGPAYVNGLETGLLSPFSSADLTKWNVATATYTHGGSYVLKGTGDGTQGVDYTVTLTQTLNSAGTISFWYMCDVNWASNAAFKIDSGSYTSLTSSTANCNASLGAGSTYDIASFGVASGTHTFTWKFSQSSGNGGSSFHIYIDDINITNVGTLGATALFNGGGVGIGLGTAIAPSYSLDVKGDARFQNASNSTTAFQIQNAGGTLNLFTSDTTNNIISIGSTTTDANAILFTLDSYNNGTDPTGANGAMYYNSSTSKFRCYQGGAWADCIATPGGGVTTVGAFSGSSQTNGASISGSTITFGPADGTNPGMVTTGTQTLAGAKTFSSLLTGSAGATINGGAVTLQGNTASSLTTSSGALTVTSAAAATWSTAAGALTVQGYAGLTLDAGSAAAVNIGNTNANAVNIGNTSSNITTTITGKTVIKPSTNNDTTTAFQVQNAAGTTVLMNADTTNLAVGVGTLSTKVGYSYVGSNSNAGAASWMQAEKITTSSAGKLSSIMLYLGAVDTAPNNNFQVAIYANTTTGCGLSLTNCPGSLIASSSDQTPTAYSWNKVPMSVNLSASTTYWLVANVESNNTATYFDTGAAAGTYVAQGPSDGAVYGTWPSSFGTDSATNTVALAMYANVNTAGDGYAINTDESGHVAIGTSTPLGSSALYVYGSPSGGVGGGANIQGSVLVQSNGYRAFSVSRSDGTYEMFRVDEANTQVTINSILFNSSSNMVFNNDGTHSISMAQANSGTGKQLTIAAGQGASGSAGGNLLLTAGANGTASGTPGSVVVQANGGNSTTAFQVQNAAGTAMLTADTTNNTLTVRAGADILPVGSNLITTTFNNATYWSCTGWTLTSTKATHNTGNTSTCSETGSNFAPTASNTYLVSFNLVANNFTYNGSDYVNFTFGGYTSENYYQSNGTVTVKITASNTNQLVFTPSSTWTGAINSLTVKQVTGSLQAVMQTQDSSGATALQVRTDATNLFMGYNSGQFNTSTTSANLGLGQYALAANSTGVRNIAVGGSSLNLNTSGTDNSALGEHSLDQNTTGSSNVAVGQYSLDGNKTGSQNTSLGAYSGYNNIKGINNTYLGYAAGLNDSGFNFVGIDGLQNSTAIGSFAQVQASNSMVLGSVDLATKVGIGSTIPLNTFSVSPVYFSTGTASQSGTTVTGASTSAGWTSAMVGMQFVFANGATGTIQSVNSGAQTLVLDTSQTVAAGTAYRIHTVGFQVTSGGNTYLQNTSTTAFKIQNQAGTALFTADTTNMSITINGHIITAGTTPSISAGTAACTSPTVSVAGTDTAGIITVTAGTGCSGTGKLATITFASAFGAAPRVILTPGTSGSANLVTYIDSSTISTTAFDLGTNTQPTNSTTYKWYYTTMQ